MIRTKSILLGSVIGVLALSGCGVQKAVEPFRDARVSDRNTTPASVGTMPDGFSNYATKCDHGNRVYVAFKGDDNRASITVVPNAVGCQ